MRRREFLGVVGAVAAWPIAAKGQGERVRRVAILLAAPTSDPEYASRVEALVTTLRQLGWMEGRNLRIEVRGSGGDAERVRQHAAELLDFSPEVFVVSGNGALGPLLQVTRTIPIVFAVVADPVGSGFVESLSRPGGNTTGFMQFEFSLSAKWVELLKQIAPTVTRVGVLWDPAISGSIAQFAIVQSAASSMGVEIIPVSLRDFDGLERSAANLARSGQGGLIVIASALANVHRDRILKLAAEHKLPAVYFGSHFIRSGGLFSYGADLVDQFRQAAVYVDRILKGEKPADLPVQAPTKYELVINLKTAKALGLTVPRRCSPAPTR